MITPGPWEVNGSLVVKDCYGAIIADTEVSIDYAPKRYVTREVSRANAQAIAKTPEMIAALQSILLARDNNTPDGMRKAIDDARPLIADLTAIAGCQLDENDVSY
jgi:hypothetical protein